MSMVKLLDRLRVPATIDREGIASSYASPILWNGSNSCWIDLRDLWSMVHEMATDSSLTQWSWLLTEMLTETKQERMYYLQVNLEVTTNWRIEEEGIIWRTQPKTLVPCPFDVLRLPTVVLQIVNQAQQQPDPMSSCFHDYPVQCLQ